LSVYFKGSEDLGGGGLNELKGGGKRRAVAVIELDVISGGSVGIESDGVTNYESYGLCLGLPNHLRRFGSSIRAMELFMHVMPISA
jgi:hypothetical protein